MAPPKVSAVGVIDGSEQLFFRGGLLVPPPQPAVEPEPTIDEPHEHQTLSVSSESTSTSPSPSWASTNLAFGDAISSVRRIFEESHYLDMAKTYSEPDLVMDLLQDVSTQLAFPVSPY